MYGIILLIMCRGILCGLFTIHSEQKICGDVKSSLYVTEDGEGSIFYVNGEMFSARGAQKDMDDLLTVMERILALINPKHRQRQRNVFWLRELREEYKLPSTMLHFF